MRAEAAWPLIRRSAAANYPPRQGSAQAGRAIALGGYVQAKHLNPPATAGGTDTVPMPVSTTRGSGWISASQRLVLHPP